MSIIINAEKMAKLIAETIAEDRMLGCDSTSFAIGNIGGTQIVLTMQHVDHEYEAVRANLRCVRDKK